MGRNKSYDRDQIIGLALHVFWTQGFHSTSTRDLTEAMQINPYSLYAEFGSKEGLFEAVMDRYEADVVEGHFGKLETAGAGLVEVREVIGFFGASASRQGSHLGCLVCNAGTEMAPTLERSRTRTAAYMARVTAAFANALNNAKARGEIAAHADTHALATHISTFLMGVFVLLRTQLQESFVGPGATQLLAWLDALSADRAETIDSTK